MKPLWRKTSASILSAAIVLGAVPLAAFANPPAPPPAPTVAPAPAAPAPLDPVKVLQLMQKWGVFKGDDDVLKTYLGDAHKLTPLGEALYLSLIKTHDPNVEPRALVEEVQGLQPNLDRLRQNGPYDAAREQGVEKTLALFQKDFGGADDAADGTVEGEFQRGALREALMTGAAIPDAPKPGDMIQVPTKDGFEFWDKKGLAYRINKNNATTYNRELQKAQHAMNQNRPSEVAFIPETGRYNPEMFDYSYFLLKDQYDALVEGMRRDRMIALADLLGVTGQYKEDMWFTDKRIEADLEAKARNVNYSHRGQDYNILQMVDDKFKQRKYYLDQALGGVQSFEKDMNALKDELKANPIIGDTQVKSLALDEQYTRRFLTLGVLETQTFYIKNQMEHLDPSSPDSEQIMKAIDETSMTVQEKAAYKLRAQEMVDRLQALRNVLEKARTTLSSADYAANLDMANAALTSSQRELGLLSTDYSMYTEIPTLSMLGRTQTSSGWSSWMDYGSKLTRGVWSATHSDYRHNMAAIAADQPKYDAIAKLIADGKLPEARVAVIALHSDAIKGEFMTAIGGSGVKITDSMRLAASLKLGHDRIADVYSTNEGLDTVGRYITWTVDMAVLAPLARSGASWTIGKLARYTGEAAAGETSALSNYAVIRRSAIVLSETLKHVEARLGSLEPDAARINALAEGSMISKVIGQSASRYLITTAVRAGSVAWRQGAFTLTSGAISGAFTAGTHYWDKATSAMLGPGQSATVNLPLIGDVGIRPGDSMFDNGWDAFTAGARGGVIWANKPMDVFGIPLIHPGLLGYVGLPSTIFRGTRLMQYAEMVGARGVVGSTFGMGKLAFFGDAAAGTAGRGFLESLAEKGIAGKIGAFSLSMTDNVAKYALFSDAAGWVGSKYAYNVPAIHAGFLGNIGGNGDEPDVERRIKGANAAGQKWLASPAWMLIPTYAAHPARDAQSAQRAYEGARQYDAAGRTGEYVNLEPGASVDFIKKPSIPLSQRFFEPSFMSAETGDSWVVTDQIKREGIKKEMVRMLGGDNATAADINPMKFYRATKMDDGADFVNLKVNDEVRLVAHQDFIESLLANKDRTAKILDAVPGSNVEGFGRVTPEVKKDVAVALYSSDMQVGKPMPAELAGKVNEILKPYLDANKMVEPAAKDLAAALDAAPAKSEALDAAIKASMDKVTEWKKTANPVEHPYTEVIDGLRADALKLKTEGKLDDKEHAVLAKLYDYLDAIEKRFNAFNSVGQTMKLSGESLAALKVQYEGNAPVRKVLDHFSTSLDEWANPPGRAARAADAIVDGPRADGSFKQMLTKLTRDLEKSKGTMDAEDFAAMKAALKEIENAPWVLHDSKGSALPSWRPEQFESLMGSMNEIALTGRAGESPQIFQMLKTGGGKTMLTFEGLLPFVEADGARRKIKPMFLTVQSNLEAQARMEFLAYKKIGSTLEFDTYEGFKTKIAEGKMKGKVALRDYWVLGDEMDGAALQPALTIGQVTGGVTRRSPVYNRIEEMDNGLANRLNNGQAARESHMLTDARRARGEIEGLDSSGPLAKTVKQAKSLAGDLEKAIGKLSGSSGPSGRAAAEAEVKRRAAALDGLLQTLPSSEGEQIVPARQALRGVVDGLAPPADAAAPATSTLGRFKRALLADPGSTPQSRARDAMLSDLQAGFTREESLLRLTGGEDGLGRLAVEAEARSAQLEVKIRSLTADAAAARDSKAPGAADHLKGVNEDLALARQELALVDRFRAQDAGTRLSNLQEKIAEAESPSGSATAEQLAGWKAQAARYEASLPEEARPVAKARAAALSKLYDLGRQAGELDGQIAEATRKSASVDQLTVRRDALEADYETTRAESARLKAELSAGSATGDLGGMMRRLDVLRGDQSPAARAERAALLKATTAEVRSRLSAAADDVVARARDGKPGWENASARLLERRREMMEAFAGDENPMYTAYRDMKDDMEAFSLNEALKSKDPAVWKPAQEKLLKMVDGQSAVKFLPKLPKLLWEVFTGRDVDIPVDRAGLTRLHAAKLLKALLSDPTMPVHQRDSLFWSLTSSLIRPGTTGKSSWVRTELLRQLHGFFEDPAGIRFDSRTGRINVVHNGQWFESMDNETRRFWELEYGADLTLPYTNQSISTINDVITDKKGRFISFSGTAGEKLRERFRANDISIVGEGSKPPAIVNLDLVPGPTNRFSRIGQALANVNSSRGSVVIESLNGAPDEARAQIEEKLGGPLTETKTLKLEDFAGPKYAQAREWLSVRRALTGDADSVVVRRMQDLPKLSDEAAKLLKDHLASGSVTGEARKALESVLNLEPVSAEGRAALEEHMKTWDKGPLEDVRGAVEAQLAANVPRDVRDAVEAQLKAKKLGGKDDAVINISELPGDESSPAKQWLRALRANQKDTGLVVLSVSDTRVLKMVKEYLTRVQGVKPSQIAMVFSDTEYLRNNVPEAKVKDQMNLDALNDGSARVLILDTRVGGRGLDLNFKGERSLDPKSFRGYTSFEMLIVDPQKMSSVHLLQAEGRIDEGRVLPGAAANRTFSLVMDVKSIAGEEVFRDMIANDPFFAQLRADPRFVEFVRKRGGAQPDWSMFNDYIRERAYDGTPDGQLLAEQYEAVVNKALDLQQAGVESNQLSSSAVVAEPQRGGGLYPGLEGMR